MKQKTASVHDYKDVTAVAVRYIEALRTGNIDMLAEIFHKDSVTYGTVNGELVGGAGNPTIDFIKAKGKSPEIEYHIDVVDITPTTAVVRLVLEKDAIGSDCNDNLMLIKLSEGWSVIAKVFHQF